MMSLLSTVELNKVEDMLKSVAQDQPEASSSDSSDASHSELNQLSGILESISGDLDASNVNLLVSEREGQKGNDEVDLSSIPLKTTKNVNPQKP